MSGFKWDVDFGFDATGYRLKLGLKTIARITHDKGRDQYSWQYFGVYAEAQHWKDYGPGITKTSAVMEVTLLALNDRDLREYANHRPKEISEQDAARVGRSVRKEAKRAP